MIWHVRTKALTIEQPLIMGIVNVTPDSFSDGGQFQGVAEAVDHGLRTCRRRSRPGRRRR